LKTNSIYYILTTAVLVFLTILVIQHGAMLESIAGFDVLLVPQKKIASTFFESDFAASFKSNLYQPLSILLLQILSILVTARFFGWLMSKIGQPTVIGEIIAGIILGPSLLGYLSPEFSAFLFPAESLNGLQFLSHLGLILFMFIVGMELEFKQIKKQLRNVVLVSNASIILPFFLGVLLAYFLYLDYGMGSSFSSFALFMGIAMSITAFPVLARIVMERNLVKSPIGSMALAIAAANDVTAWFLLAIVIAIVNAGNFTSALFTIIFSFAFVFTMLVGVKYFLKIMSKAFSSRETVNKPIIALIFVILILAAWTAEVIGIHSLFGAFIAGVSVPSSSRFRHLLAQKIEDISLVLLLPIFFVFTGLRTEIGVLSDINLWGVLGLVLIAAITGKFLGSALSARWVGISWKNSLILGTLMNTRGLMELIVLNIGYDLGILSTEIFSVLVFMAIATTLMTGPLLNLINYIFKKRSEGKSLSGQSDVFNILISFGEPHSGSRLMELGGMLFGNNSLKEVKFTAMHLTPSADITIKDAKVFESEGFKHINSTARSLNIKFEKHYKTSHDVSRDIIHYANNGNFDLMLAGSSRPLFSTKLTGGKVRFMFEGVNNAVGILIDRGFKNTEKIIFIIDDDAEPLLTFKTSGLLQNENFRITILDLHNIFHDDDTLWGIRNRDNSQIIQIIKNQTPEEAFISDYDIVICGLGYWDKTQLKNSEWINFSPSILVVN